VPVEVDHLGRIGRADRQLHGEQQREEQEAKGLARHRAIVAGAD
jgi:hypothetical protein